MQIETERLVIRTLELCDSEAWITMFNDPEVSPYSVPDDTVTTPELYQGVMELRQVQERERGYAMWAVEARETGTFIGQCEFYLSEGKGPEVEIGYHYPPASWNKGYGTEAAVAVLTYGFGPVGTQMHGAQTADLAGVLETPGTSSKVISAGLVP
jgi:RimJ/RimL family protein N-acetyltransferase